MYRRRSISIYSVALVLMFLGRVVPYAGAQPSWPNLDVLQNYPKPGTSCSLRGAASQGSE